MNKIINKIKRWNKQTKKNSKHRYKKWWTYRYLGGEVWIDIFVGVLILNKDFTCYQANDAIHFNVCFCFKIHFSASVVKKLPLNWASQEFIVLKANGFDLISFVLTWNFGCICVWPKFASIFRFAWHKMFNCHIFFFKKIIQSSVSIHLS